MVIPIPACKALQGQPTINHRGRPLLVGLKMQSDANIEMKRCWYFPQRVKER